MSAQALFQVVNLHKSFRGTVALKDVDLDVQQGEFHALLGENGAGKSTLIKVSTGVYPADAGEVRWRGKPVKARSPVEAQQMGIGVVHQDSSLLPGLSVVENVALGQEPVGPAGWVRWAEALEKVRQHSAHLPIDLDPETPVERLSVAKQKWVAILRALTWNPDFLILDEPTAALTMDETERLMELLLALKEQGKAILYITHRLHEIGELVDRVSILKDGQKVATLPADEAAPQRILGLMVGRDVGAIYPTPKEESPGQEILRLERLERLGAFSDVDLSVRRGEIVGLVGLQGHGHFATARALFGAPGPERGRVWVRGRPVSISCPLDAIRAGIGFLSEDRVGEGVFPGLTVRENLSVSVLRRLARLGWIPARREDELTGQLMELLSIKAPSAETPIDALSGGNQQKVTLSRWLAADMELLILLDPTAGVDMGARIEIYSTLRRLADEGKAVLIATSDLSEAVGLCDRVYSFYKGKVSGHFRRGRLSEASLLAAMTGHSDEVVE